MELKKAKAVCISAWQKTGGTPIRFWSIGSKDVPPPPTQTREEAKAKRRERKVLIREVTDNNHIALRDPAAAWF